jgi:hypothetical protein
LNQRPFKKRAGCRRSLFEQIDGPALRPLPAQRYDLSVWSKALVNIDYFRTVWLISMAKGMMPVIVYNHHPLGVCYECLHTPWYLRDDREGHLCWLERMPAALPLPRRCSGFVQPSSPGEYSASLG